MSDEVLMLAKKFDIKKCTFPVVATEKLDGVAADFYGTYEGDIEVRSRQDKPILSVAHIQEWLKHRLPPTHHLICELYIPGVPFKDVSGMVRKQENNPAIQAHVYDYYMVGGEHLTYKARMNIMAENIGSDVLEDPNSPVRLIPGHYCHVADNLRAYIEKFSQEKPNAEGLVIRDLTGPNSGYKFGRSWGMQKLKNQGTVDLEIHSFEEAIDKDGNPKGMVGRINVLYHTGASSDGKNEYTDYEIIGAGPGKMSHAERTKVWKNQKDYIGRIAEISYMPDPAYNALREPRFYRWRDDKSEPSQE